MEWLLLALWIWYLISCCWEGSPVCCLVFFVQIILSRPLSRDVLVWRSMYGWNRLSKWSYLCFAFSASRLCNPVLCLVPLHPGGWSMTRFRVAYASVTSAQLIQAWVSACFLLLTATDAHLCPTYTSPQSSTPSIRCACPSHHAMNVDISFHIFLALFARERLVSGAGSLTS